MKRAKKLLSLILCFAMCVGMLPTAAFATGGGSATPTGSVKTVMAGTSGIKDPTAEGNTEGTYYTPNSYIYFGQNSGTPIKWRVLDADKANTGAAGMFLLSEHLLASEVYFQQTHHIDSIEGGYTVYRKGASHQSGVTEAPANAWQGSDAQIWAKTFAESGFNSGEQAALLATTKEDGPSTNYSMDWGTGELTGDKVFFLSAEELAQYVGNYHEAPGLGATPANSSSAGRWWLRSAYDGGRFDMTGAVTDEGSVSYGNITKEKNAARPAFNLDLSKVLFTSAAGSAKPDGFKQVQSYTGNEWKLTLKDTNAIIEGSVELQDSSWNKVEELTVGYGPNDFEFDICSTFSRIAGYTNITAMLSNNDSGEVVYYGSIGGSPPEDGSQFYTSIDLPTGLEAGSYTLSVYGEQWNGANKTDYATAQPLTYEFTVKVATTPYDLWVDGVQVTSANADNVLNKTNGDGEPTVSFDATSNTLTLSGATITETDDTYLCGIYSKLDNLTLKLIGDSTITVNDTGDGLYTEGNLTVTGSGSLTATVPYGNGVAVAGNLTVESGTLTGKATSNNRSVCGIVTKGNLTVYGGSVTGKTTALDYYAFGIEVYGDLSVESGSVAGEGTAAGIYAHGGATINGGDLTGEGMFYGIVVEDTGLIVNGGSVTGRATLEEELYDFYGTGIVVANLFKVTDSAVQIRAYGLKTAILVQHDDASTEELISLPTDYLPETYKIVNCIESDYKSAWIATSDTPDEVARYTGAVKELSLPAHMHGETPFMPLTQTEGDLAGGTYFLDDKVTLTDSLNIKDGDVTLCLNGKTLDCGSGNGMGIDVAKGGKLTICDCSEKQTGACRRLRWLILM
ncbi:MAG: DUF6273 domain-containing protein [Eubacteriales bacterium]|nr:DUF6273 domain-containing protein [Eubacteriales bacterium]